MNGRGRRGSGSSSTKLRLPWRRRGLQGPGRGYTGTASALPLGGPEGTPWVPRRSKLSHQSEVGTGQRGAWAAERLLLYRKHTGLNLSRLTWNFVLALSLIFCVNLMNSLPAPGFSFLTRRALGCNVIQSRGAFAGGRASSLTFILCPFCKACGILRFQCSRANGVIPVSMH